MFMKKLIYLFILFSASFFINESSEAQWRINAYGGYSFDDDVDAVTSTGAYFNSTLKGNAIYGAGIEYVLQNNYGLEVLWYGQSTKAKLNYSTAIGNRDTTFEPGIGLNWIMFAGNAYTKLQGSPIEPFGSFMLGVGIINNKDPLPGAETSTTKFGYGFRAGTNIWASEQVGFKIMGQFLSAAQAFGGGLFIGSGGVSPSVSPESSMLQFSIGGGIIVKLGGSKRR